MSVVSDTGSKARSDAGPKARSNARSGSVDAPLRSSSKTQLSSNRLGNAFGIAVMAIIAAVVSRPAPDPDRFWHLATGRWIFENKKIPTTDPFSWTAPGRSWVAHEWLTEAVWYALHRVGGWPALALLTSAIVTTAFVIVWRSAVRLGVNRYLASVLVVLGASATAHTWGVRPQMLTIALIAWMMSLFHRTWADGQTRRLWWIPVVMILWCNAHGGYVFGLAVLFAYAMGVTVDVLLRRIRLFAFRSNATQVAGSLAKNAWIVFALTIAATFINPHGASGLLYPFTYLGDNASTRYIVEWFAPRFGDSQYTPFFLLVALLALVALRLWRTLPMYAAFAIAGMTILGLQSVRNIPPFVVVVLPWIGLALSSSVRRTEVQTGSVGAAGHGAALSGSAESVGAALSGSAESVGAALSGSALSGSAGSGAAVSDTDSVRADRRPSAGMVVGVGAAILGAIGLALPGLAPAAIAKSDRTTFPIDAVTWMNKNPRQHVLNEYSWGGYLTWYAPDSPVAVDGRPDMYGDEFVDRHLSIWWAHSGWEQKLDHDKYERVIGPPTAPIVAALRSNAGWSVAYEDERAVILDRK